MKSSRTYAGRAAIRIMVVCALLAPVAAQDQTPQEVPKDLRR